MKQIIKPQKAQSMVRKMPNHKIKFTAVSMAVLAIMASPLNNGALPAPFSADAAFAQAGQVTPNETLVLSIGAGKLVNLPSAMSDVFVANDNIADVQVKSNRQLYVFGKAGGETTLFATSANGNVLYSATIRVDSNISSLDQMLTLAMPDAKISVSTINNMVLLTGVVKNPDDSEEASRLVKAFMGDDTKVVSRLKTSTPLQVNLHVRVAEVNRSLVKAIGTNLATRDATGGFTFGVNRANRNFVNIGDTINTSPLPRVDASGQFGLPEGSVFLPFDPSSGKFITGGSSFDFTNITNGTTALQVAGKLFGIDVAAAFDLAEDTGLVTTLSQPNLTALSGHTATFLAGGEFPIPISQQLGTISIEYRKFGVGLSYTPTVLSDGRISLHVRPEVSELSAAGAVQLNGYQVPALTVRRAETTVELGSGQSFMIAGLLSNNSQNNVSKAPGLGDIGILGSLFKSTNFQRGETELVIVITPYLVNPVDDPSDIVLPTDGFSAPHDAARIFMNKQSGTPQPRPMPQQNEAVTRQVGQENRPSASAAPSNGAATPGFSFGDGE